jgi:predicted acyltransferase
MKPHWWGILGLIGWAYFLCALVYFLAGARLWIIIPAWLILYALNVQEFTGLPGFSSPLRLIVSASNYALVMSGVLASVFYKKLNESGRIKLFIALLISLAAISFLYGFAMRPEWGISKIRATPAWTAICAGISFAFFACMYWIADIWNKTRWAGFMRPAGRSTLTCYLVPYIFYPTLGPLIMMIPDPLTGGITGLVKSMIFALLVVGITGLLEKINIRLKI